MAAKRDQILKSSCKKIKPFDTRRKSCQLHSSWIRNRISNADTDPGEPDQCGSGCETLR